jgi:hypothetical protein
MGRAEAHLGRVAEEEWMPGWVVAHREAECWAVGKRAGRLVANEMGNLRRERRSEVAARGADWN